jgi:hypothetical protein
MPLSDSTLQALITLKIHAFDKLVKPSKQSRMLINVGSQEREYWASLETR